MTTPQITPSSSRSQHSAAGYVVAFACVAIITKILLVIQSNEMSEVGYYVHPYGILYLLAVTLIASRWGSRQAFLALILSLAASKCFLVPPHFSWHYASERDFWGAVALCLVGTLLTLALAEQRHATKQSQNLLRTVSHQQRELQAILDSMSDAMVITDFDGNILTMNPAALHMHGYERIEEAQRPANGFMEDFELFQPDWRPIPHDQWPICRAIRGEQFTNYELHVRRCDTGKFWDASYAGNTVFDKDGNPILVLLSIRDITERHHIEQALEISEERLRLAIDGAGIGTWHWDLRADQMLWSPRSKALYGLPAEEDVSFNSFLNAIHPADRDMTQRLMTEALLDKSRLEIRHRSLRPDGSYQWIASIGHGHYDAAGEALYMEGIVMPATADPSAPTRAAYLSNLPQIYRD